MSNLAKGSKAAIEKRLAYRQDWLGRALNQTEGCDLVFFDPDNGLEVKSTPRHHDRAPKYAYYEELLPFWKRGQSLLIYQHKNMHETTAVQMRTRADEIRERLSYTGPIHVIHYAPAGGRMFFLVPQLKDSKILKKKLDSHQLIKGIKIF